ncbi:peptidase C15, pyroglutamyl peptidase I-like protein [Ophiobolus disseminans]|uniref:Peptidase C15, pyroglutamyl peptidase I-like protein n=1 Tax=Ophiobolus disseminans TaxID=1469910 RepID=A0A6A7A205_9PLEO|nr:peptidase C15, pyroglutamyl peptidase I-like protein [Ophiobolus disseminans]
MRAIGESYAARQPPGEEGEKPVTVLVTGFGPFLLRLPRNSSWEIASTLPALIPSSPTNPTPIHIHVHHEAIRVAYNNVAELVPKLLPPANLLRPEPDVILHIGLAAGRKFFTLEQGAHGRGYGFIPDVDGERFPDTAAEKRFPASKYPTVLKTSFDTSDVLARWKANLGYSSVEGTAEYEDTPDVRLSPDAGNFLCGFTYYNSLAHYYSIKEDERPVAFMHCPDLTQSEDDQREGWDVAVALIKALVESKRKNGAVDPTIVHDQGRNEARDVQVDDTTTQLG